jgi:hypothetical protein
VEDSKTQRFSGIELVLTGKRISACGLAEHPPQGARTLPAGKERILKNAKNKERSPQLFCRISMLSIDLSVNCKLLLANALWVIQKVVKYICGG